jgi:hypothetical protein
LKEIGERMCAVRAHVVSKALRVGEHTHIAMLVIEHIDEMAR